MNKVLKYIIWDFSGIRLICRKAFPEKLKVENAKDYRKPSSLLLWLIGIYIAAFGLASQKYQNKLQRAEYKVNLMTTQLSTKHFKKVISSVPRLQNLKCPVKPKVLNPLTTFKSLFYEDTFCYETREELKRIVSQWRSELSGVDFYGIDLSNTNLTEANFQNSMLRNANLSGSNLTKATFKNAHTGNTSFNQSFLRDTDFTNTNIKSFELLNAKNLKGIKGLESNTENELKKARPSLFNKIGYPKKTIED